MTCSLSSNRENQKERKIAANVGKDRKPAAVFDQEPRSGAKTAIWSCNERKKKHCTYLSVFHHPMNAATSSSCFRNVMPSAGSGEKAEGAE